jgi:cytochrome c peroxidase
MPYVGFSGPIPSVNRGLVAYPGSLQYRFGKRKPQEYSYSPFFPVLHHNQAQGAFFGGNFWDSRATGYRLQSADAEQAQGPDVDPGRNGKFGTAIGIEIMNVTTMAAILRGYER